MTRIPTQLRSKIRDRARELYLEADEKGRRKYSIAEIGRILQEEYGPNAPRPYTVYKWAERENWEAMWEAKLLEKKAQTIDRLSKTLGTEDELLEARRKLDEQFSKASSAIVVWQLELCKRMNGIIKTIDLSHPKFTRLVELTDKVNQTAFGMLKEIGYGGVDNISTKPVIIINEIDGRKIVIQEGREYEEAED